MRGQVICNIKDEQDLCMEFPARFLFGMSRGGMRQYFLMMRMFFFGLDCAMYTLHPETGTRYCVEESFKQDPVRRARA